MLINYGIVIFTCHWVSSLTNICISNSAWEPQEFSFEPGDTYTICHMFELFCDTQTCIFYLQKKFFFFKIPNQLTFCLSVVAAFRKDAAVLQYRLWVGLQMRCPGLQGVCSHRAQCRRPLESYLTLMPSWWCTNNFCRRVVMQGPVSCVLHPPPHPENVG